MHPEILRELSAQHRRELRERASQATAAKAARAQRHTHVADEFAVPEIPDYVDGSFRTDEVPATSGRAA